MLMLRFRAPYFGSSSPELSQCRYRSRTPQASSGGGASDGSGGARSASGAARAGASDSEGSSLTGLRLGDEGQSTESVSRTSSSSSSSSSSSGGGASGSAAALGATGGVGSGGGAQLLLSGLEPALAPFAAAIGERRFTCTQCGKCCTGSGSVWVSDQEAAGIAEHLALPLRRFLDAFAQGYSKVPGWWLLRNDPASGQARNCIFLRPDNTCGIHAVRPIQCSTYPWWPELMEPAAWDKEKREICEGFDHPDAPPTDLAEAARQLRTATAHNAQRQLAFPPPKPKARRAAPPGGAADGRV
ncbi:MAG: hypothetical protein J3K34DRAFT_249163 [Monoraphidium minutum]|nr:MAG: hypothetical protein J3K34DRAFT_249163 [Monoraphidium minutum]